MRACTRQPSPSSRCFWAPRLAIFLLGPGLIAAQDRAAAPLSPIDDAKLRHQFQAAAEAWISDSSIPRGTSLLESWKTRKDSPTWSRPSPTPTGDKPAPQLAPQDVYRRAAPATLILGHLYKCGKCAKWHPSLAGGVVIDPSGIAVTNYHVLKTARAEIFGAMRPDGEVFPVMEILAASEPDDLAVIRLRVPERQKPLPSIRLAPVNDPPGTDILVISHPDGRFFTCSDGMIARHFLAPDTKSARTHITADYARGSSGCGVFNLRGELTALVSSTQSIYYSEEKGVPQNLQMVVKSTIPVGSLLKLLEIPPR
ncbi:MAG: serine protease, S1-C subfamily, contains C-terminal PDZ domain [Verrucomicrobia bacterium]|nr:MAG: serine protease, S1-C subfamily, contains C-terminal PDZ domain [Verrucomicrobiota bacterium]